MEVAGKETDLELFGPVVEDAVVVAGERVDMDEPGQPDRQLALPDLRDGHHRLLHLELPHPGSNRVHLRIPLLVCAAPRAVPVRGPGRDVVRNSPVPSGLSHHGRWSRTTLRVSACCLQASCADNAVTHRHGSPPVLLSPALTGSPGGKRGRLRGFRSAPWPFRQRAVGCDGAHQEAESAPEYSVLMF